MALSTRDNNTMAEGLGRVLQELTKMKLMPDADLSFIVNLETNIIGYLRPPPAGPPGQQPGPPGGPMGGAMGQVMGGGPPAFAPGAGGVPPGGGGPSFMSTNPDEMRRMLGQVGMRNSLRRLTSKIIPVLG